MPPLKQPGSDSPVRSLDTQGLEILSRKSFGEQVCYDLPFGKGLHSEKGIFSAEQLLHMATKDGFTNLFDEPFANVEEMLYAAECDLGGIYTGDESLEDIQAFIGECTRCKLCEGRSHIVQTKGPESARVMFVGEAPSESQDLEGDVFAGNSGRLLTNIIHAMGFELDEVAVANVVRCRPPKQRFPTAREILTCKQFLLHEIALIAPEVIVTLGCTATSTIVGTDVSFSDCLGNFFDRYRSKVMPTYHPAHLLRFPSKKPIVWQHMKRVLEFLSN